MYGASPSGVGQADGTVYRIHKIQRNTIRIKSRQHNARGVRDHAVDLMKAARAGDAAATVFFSHTPDIGGVGLVGSYDSFKIKSRRFRKTPEIFGNVFRIVSSGVA